jgi:hypothetical protein
MCESHTAPQSEPYQEPDWAECSSTAICASDTALTGSTRGQTSVTWSCDRSDSTCENQIAGSASERHGGCGSRESLEGTDRSIVRDLASSVARCKEILLRRVFFQLVREDPSQHTLLYMSGALGDLVEKIEAERDDFVRRCNAAIAALLGNDRSQTGDSPKHRFTPERLSQRPIRHAPLEAEQADQPPARPKKLGRKPRILNESSAKNGAMGQAPRTVKEMIKEAVRSQTGPFSLREVKEHVARHYPGEAAKIPSERYSKELYHLRVVEKLFDISSAGEKGAPNVYVLRSA